ncbi:MAG: lamin tail domain-containing protein [Minisyncoccia bacterium]
MRITAIIFLFCVPSFASAQVLINEIQISPIGERFIELYNSGNSNIDLTGWYIQRKTATGSSFGSLVTSTQLNGKTIKANSYFLISRSQLGSPDMVIDNLTLTEANTARIRDSKGEDIDQIEWATIDEGKSYQRISSSEWTIAVPTPGVINATSGSSQNQSTNVDIILPSVATSVAASFLVEPQIFADAGASVRTVSSGASIVFTGRAFGLKKEPIENARMIWSFGDGGSAEGMSVAHTYYYPGDYVAVLDVASGYYSASDRATVRVSAPLIVLSVGGNQARSFVALENSGVDEMDLSDWQVASNGKNFIFPKNTILSSRKTLTLASEVTGLVTPAGSIAELRFPNGSRVSVKSVEKKELASSETLPRKVKEEPKIKPTTQIQPAQTATLNQKASISDAFSDTQTSLPSQKGDGLWPWYIGAAFLSAFALLGIRLTKGDEEKTSITVEDFEIIEEVEDNEPH